MIHSLDPLAVDGPLDRDVSTISCDVRSARPGSLYVAAPGLAPAAAERVLEAEERGVSAVICERRPHLPGPATRICVRDAREALARVSASFYEHPAAQLRLIGVAGGRARAPLAYILRHLFEAAGRPAGLLGTLGHRLGKRFIPAPRWSPTALEIHPMLAGLLRGGLRTCLVEITPELVASRQLAGLGFDTVVHAPGGGDCGLPAADGPQRPRAVRLASAPSLSPFDRSTLHAGGSAARMYVAGRQVTVRVPVTGRSLLRLACAAVEAGVACGLDLDSMLRALAELPPVPGHLEPVPGTRDFGVFADAASDADGLRSALADLRELAHGRLLVLLGASAAAGTAGARELGRVAARIADHVVVTTHNPGRECPARLARALVAGLEDFAPPIHQTVLDRRLAIAAILREAQPGDLVLLAGKGHAAYQEYDDAVAPFDDRLHAAAALEERRAR
ncbi:MAG: glutamate ligase domain-containing protein [Limisphaerales bacterium]